MPTCDLRPERLTPDLIATHLFPLMRKKIRAFAPHEECEELLHQILSQMMLPSEKLGTSYLDRYDPARGTAATYVLMYVTQALIKRHQLEKSRREKLGQPVSIAFDGDYDSEWEHGPQVEESGIEDPNYDESRYYETVRTAEDLDRLLAGTRHAQARTMAPSGEPRSTLYMLKLLVFGNFTVPEVATRLSVSPSEVNRRLRDLRTERCIQALAAL